MLNWNLNFEPGELTDAVFNVFEWSNCDTEAFDDYYDRRLRKLFAKNGIEFGSMHTPEKERFYKQAEVYALQCLISDQFGSDEAFNEAFTAMMASGSDRLSDELVLLLEELTKPVNEKKMERERDAIESKNRAMGFGDNFDTGSWKDYFRESRRRRIKESVSFSQRFDFSDVEDEDVIRELYKDMHCAYVKDSELEALGIDASKAVNRPIGIYSTGIGTPDVVIVDSEVRYSGFCKYYIEVYLINRDCENIYDDVVSYLNRFL